MSLTLSENLQDYISAILGMKQPYRLTVILDNKSEHSNNKLLLQRLLEADSLWNLGDSTQSLKVLQSVQPQLKNDADSKKSSTSDDDDTQTLINFAEGLESLNQGDLTKALSCFRRAAEASNHLPLLRTFFTERAVNIAFWMACSGQMLEAAKILQDSQATPFAGGILSFAHHMEGDSVLAESIARQAIAKGLDDPWTIHAVAHALTSQDKHQECADWILLHKHKTEDCNPFMKGHFEFHLALSYIYLQDATKLKQLIQGSLWGTMSDEMKSDYWNASGILNVLWKAELRGLVTNPFDDYSAIIQQALEKVDAVFQGKANAAKSSVFSLCIFRFTTASMRAKWTKTLLGEETKNDVLSAIAKAIRVLYHGSDQQQVMDPLLICGTKPIVEPIALKLCELGASPEQRETIDDFVKMIQDAS